MMKEVLKRAFISFVIGVTLSEIIRILIEAIGYRLGYEITPVIPEFGRMFPSVYIALGVQNLLVGIISATFGASSVIFEIEKWSYLFQGIVHFIITSAVWFPVSILCWGLGTYQKTAISIIISFSFTYVVTWIAKYIQLKKMIVKMNEKLSELNSDETVK